MKKHLLVLFSFILLVNFVFSQKGKAWFEAGLKGGGGLSLIVNKNVWDDKKACAPSFSAAYSYGGRLAVNLSENHQVAFESMWGMRSQQYSFLIDSVQYEKSFKLSINDLALFYRFNGNNGGYVELGGQMTMISKATEKNSLGEFDIKNNFQNYTSGCLGFGGNIVQSGSFTWTAGVRISYSFTDAISNDGGANSDFTYPLNDPIVRKGYSTYKLTKPIAIQVLTEFNFDLGYFAKSNCKRGRVSFMTF